MITRDDPELTDVSQSLKCDVLVSTDSALEC